MKVTRAGQIQSVFQNNDINPDLNILTAWGKGYTGLGVVLSILDDGIEKDHPDLAANYVTTLGFRNRLLRVGVSRLQGRVGAGALVPPAGRCAGNSSSPGLDQKLWWLPL